MADREPITGLVEAARAGDQDAWARLVERFAPLVYGITRAYRLAPADQDEVVGTVWLRLVQHLDRLRVPEALPGWISRTTKNEALHVIRLRRRTVPTQDVADRAGRADEPEVDEAILAAEARHALREAMGTLKERERQLMVLLLEEPPLGYAEIGERLDMPVGSIGPTRQRCLEKLRRSLPLVALGTDGGGAGRSRGR
jgi:RNA polymerase sigma factor (sigma-70 family)